MSPQKWFLMGFGLVYGAQAEELCSAPVPPYVPIPSSFMEISGGVYKDQGKNTLQTRLASDYAPPSPPTPSTATLTQKPPTLYRAKSCPILSIAIGHDRVFQPQCPVSLTLGFELRHTLKFGSKTKVPNTVTTSDNKYLIYNNNLSWNIKNNGLWCFALRPGLKIQKTFLHLIVGINMQHYKAVSAFNNGSLRFGHQRKFGPTLGLGINQMVTNRFYMGLSGRVHFGQKIKLQVKDATPPLANDFDKSIVIGKNGIKCEFLLHAGYKFGQ